MRDARKQLVTALIADIKTRIPGAQVYTKVPKKKAYPYIWISDIYQDEDGPKNSYQYNYDVLIQVVYKGESDPSDRYDNQNAILGMVDNASGFALTDDFSIMKTSLISNSESTDLKTDSGILDIGLIRLGFLIQDELI